MTVRQIRIRTMPTGRAPLPVSRWMRAAFLRRTPFPTCRMLGRFNLARSVHPYMPYGTNVSMPPCLHVAHDAIGRRNSSCALSSTPDQRSRSHCGDGHTSSHTFQNIHSLARFSSFPWAIRSLAAYLLNARNTNTQIPSASHTKNHVLDIPRSHNGTSVQACRTNDACDQRDEVSTPTASTTTATTSTQCQSQLQLHNLVLDQPTAYQIAAAICSLRASTLSMQDPDDISCVRHRIEIPIGRKLGFTNRTIWQEYGIDASNWSYIYDTTVVSADDPESTSINVRSHTSTSPEHLQNVPAISLQQFSNLEPRIEPELVIHLSSTPKVSMSPAQVLTQCVDWIAPGFEVVVSLFPNWMFTAAETTAAFALHGKLIIGEKIPLSQLLTADSGQDNAENHLLQLLKGFQIELLRDGELVDTGTGANVLGSPIQALMHTLQLLGNEGDKHGNPPLRKGEIVTTGTLTRAWPITSRKDGECWTMRLGGLEVTSHHGRFRKEIGQPSENHESKLSLEVCFKY